MKLCFGLALVALVACSELPAITPGVCGNGVLESQEDCDDPTILCQACGIVCADDQQCQSGWTCGYDDVCHAPGGKFADASATEPFPVLGFRISDINGDLFGDVVGQNPSALAVRYGDVSGQLSGSATVVTPSVEGYPALTHLEDPLVDDLVMPVIDGLVVYTGALGVPSPRNFPLGGGAAMPGGFFPFTAVQVDSSIGLFGPEPGSTNVTFALLTVAAGFPGFDAQTSQLCGRTILASEWIDQDIVSFHTPTASFAAFTPADGDTCVLMIKKTPTLRGSGTCPQQPSPTPDCEYQIESVTTTSFVRVAQLPVLADLDGDGCPSLISSDGGLASLVEYAGTTGGTAGCQLSTAPTALPPINESALSTLIGSVPVLPAVAGLRNEALVTSFGIYGLPTSAGPVTPMYTGARRMQRTTAGDLDGDGAYDVVLTTASEPNLDVARRVPSQPAFLLVREVTTGAVTQSLIGDFDGDRRQDLAYVEQLGITQRLSITYGGVNGLEAAVAADTFDNVEFLARMQVRDSTDPFGLVDDLVAIDAGDSQGTREITLLHGSPQRTMLSFYGPTVPEAKTRFRAVVAGNFYDANPTDDMADPLVDLFAFQTALDRAETAIYVIPGLPKGRLGEPLYGGGPMTAPPTTTRVDDCLFASAEFCLDHSRLLAWPTSIEHDIVLGVDVRIDASGNLLPPSLLRVDPGDPSLTMSIRNDVFQSGGVIHSFDAGDLDGDGEPELIASFTSSQPTRRDGYTVICHVTRDGTVESCTDVAADIIGDPQLECVASGFGHVTPTCRIGNPLLRDLVVVCRDSERSRVYAIRGEGGTLVTSEPLLDLVGARLSDVQVGDVNGDRVDDLVLLDEVSGIPVLQVFLQLTTREVDACYVE